MKLSLALIAKDETEHFRRILNEFANYFDEIVIAVDEKIDEFKDIAKDYKQVKILPYTWCNDFSHKRNFVHKNITGDYYFRLDMDDRIIKPENIHKVAEKANDNNTSIVYMYYLYSKDQWGNCNAAHWREGIIKNTDNLYWNKKIHENILPRNKSEYNIELNDTIQIEHLIDDEHVDKSILRNIKYLIDEYNQDRENTDPRTLAYLGKMFHSVRQYKQAIFFLEKHINKSGWDEDRYYSWCSLADCYRRMENYEVAKGAAFEALQERPDYPDAYLKLHDIYFDQCDWVKAEEFGRQGLLKEIPKTFMLQDPSSYGWLPMVSMAHCLFQNNKFKEALKMLLLAKNEVPTLDYIKENEPHFRQAVQHMEFMEKFLGIVNYLKENSEEIKIVDLLKSVPKDLDENEIIIKLRQYYNPAKEWKDNEVVIFADSGAGDWSPKSVKTGIGGSEEAIIYLSKELTELGWKVTVYNNCGLDEGIYNGVEYKNVIKFNPKDSFNILVSWRQNIFTYKIQAKNKIIWLHDLPVNIEFNEDTIKTFDKIVVLSKYHASTLPAIVPKDKIFLSSNGINPEDFIGLDKVERNPHRIIYASSYNRGLEQLLEMWGDIRKEVPDAELHIYYGWDTYDKFIKEGFLKDDGFKNRILELLKQNGVYEHGRIGHKELLIEYAKSGVFAYPCTYSGEIQCIALTKGIACGCKVVTNDFAVMSERSPNFVSSDKFKDVLVETLKTDSYKYTDTTKYIQDNSWSAIAYDWSKNLFPIPTPIIIKDRIPWILEQFNKDEKIIDIGANKGHIFNGWDRDKITSVDIDKYDYEGFVQADASNLPFPDKLFDKALLAEIVEHTKDPIKVLAEARRVANKVIITVPYEYEWDSALEPFAKLEQKSSKNNFENEIKSVNPAKEFYNDNYAHLFHETFYTPELLREHLIQAGYKNFSIFKIRYTGWSWLGVIANG